MAKKLAFDRVLFTAVMALVGLGLAMVYSASAVVDRAMAGGLNTYLLKQSFAAGVGLLAMWVAMHVDYRKWGQRWLVWSMVLGVVLLQVLALLGPSLNNSKRWLLVGGLSIQPSEPAKVALVIYLSYQIAKRAGRARERELVIPAVLVGALLSGLVFLARDLGGALLLGAATGLMLFLAGMPWLHLGLGALSLSPLIITAVARVPYRRARLLAFLDPETDPLGSGFQASQSLIAVGSGGILGLGLGESVQKLHYLPYPHSDFVFAIIAEELGLLGALGVLGLFGVLVWRGFRAGLRAPDDFGRYLAWGLVGMIVIQALVHVSVALSLLPTTGVTLPFLSYGGSSLVVCLFASGVVLNVSQHG